MATAAEDPSKRVFISYSRSDRERVRGLALLLEALGNKVFLDQTTIKPGMRWQAELQDGLVEAEVLLVFWTKRGAKSEWVRKEYEFFATRHPDRQLVPVLGDETPLSAVLEQYQRSDFSPLLNELLALKRRMAGEGAGSKQVNRAILERLAEAGIELDESQQARVLGLFAPTGFLALLASPLVAVKLAGTSGLEAAAQLSGAQAALVGAAAVSGALVYGTADLMTDSRSEVEPQLATETGEVKLTARLGEGGPTVHMDDWRAYHAQPDELGNWTEVLDSGGDGPVHTMPAGSYLVRGWEDRATTEKTIELRAGETHHEEFILDAGLLKLTARLGEGGPTVHMDDWRAYHAQPDELGNWTEVLDSGGDGPVHTMPAGSYLVRGWEDRATTEKTIEVRAGETHHEEFILDAGLLKLTARLGEGGPTVHMDDWRAYHAQPDELGNWTEVLDSGGDGPVHTMPAGSYLVRGWEDRAITEKTIEVRAGETHHEEFILDAGLLKLTARLGEGGPTVHMDDWRAYHAQPDELGNWTEVLDSGGDGPVHTMPAGSYLVRGWEDRATTEKTIEVRAGETRHEEFILEAGLLKLTARLGEGGPTVHMDDWRAYHAQPDELGNWTEVLDSGGDGPVHTMPAGSYLVRGWEGNETVETVAQVTAGSTTHVALVLSP